MQLTVQNLIERKELKIELLAGAHGILREVVWAHTSELEDPSAWVLENHLILTTGLGIPRQKLKQRAYIERLVNANLAGLAISSDMNAPEDLSELLNIAEEHDFPVMMIDYNVPFIEVSKAVMAVNQDKREAMNQQLISTLYEHTKELIKEHRVVEFLERISKLLSLTIYIVDSKKPEFPLFKTELLPENLLKRFKKIDFTKRKTQRIIEKNQPILHIVPINSQDFTLVIYDDDLSQELIQSLALLISIYIENRKENFEQKMVQGSDLLDDILNARVNESYINHKLTHFQLDLEKCCFVLGIFKENIDYKQIFFKYSIYSLTLIRQGRVYVITDIANSEFITHYFTQVAISNPIKRTTRIVDAWQEARLTYKQCSKNFPVQVYTQKNYSKYSLPRNLEDAKHVFEFNLGALYQQDLQRKTRYINTLKIFLEQDRSWEKTSKILHIHKQTLVYRIQRVQEITGRQMNSTEDVVELWISLKAGEILGLIVES